MSETCNPLYPVLLVDDEAGALESLSIALDFLGYNNVLTCRSAEEAARLLETQDVEAVLLDMVMPGRSGEDFLSDLTLRLPEVPVVMVTALTDVETAVRCMRKGAFDYVTKPVDADRLAASLAKALERRSLNRQLQVLTRNALERPAAVPQAFGEFLTRNPEVISILRYCEAVAQSQEPVLITGETGTGKELVARGLHRASERRGRFVAVNVAGLDDQVFADTLFGHKRGAYTGAEQTRLGLVEKAARGTLFLDEIGELSESSQIKLLRLLQEREFYPLGSDIPVACTARIVVATHADLLQAQEEGRFRRDLYYRLRTHTLQLPGLRRRKDDLPLLLEHFLAEAAEQLGKEAPAYPRELLVLLDTYHFPGNVRELRAMVFDAVSTCQTPTLSLEPFTRSIRPPHSPAPGSTDGENPLFQGLEALPTLREAADALVDEALNRAKGNQRIAAGMLGITASALNKRLKQREQERE